MKTTHHAAASVLISGFLYAISRSWGLTVGSLLAGVLTDADHVIDYWIEHGLRFDVKRFFSILMKKTSRTEKSCFLYCMVGNGWVYSQRPPG